jgi:5-(carboxyamino)imidazole ribonucleotide synthase
MNPAPSGPTTSPVIGIVGAGQLALMMFEASLRLGLEIRVLGGAPDDPALRVVKRGEIGNPRDAGVLRTFADGVDVVTFDHELIDIDLVMALERAGKLVRPGSRALSVAIDKRQQHDAFRHLEIEQPPTYVAVGVDSLRAAVTSHSFPIVVKHASGGYDGRGVQVIERRADLEQLIDSISPESAAEIAFVVQPKVEIDLEIAVQVVRSVHGEIVSYPVVRTVQEEGICRMVHVPADIPVETAQNAVDAAVRLAQHLDVVGVLAVEFFLSGGRLLVNEIATRPHNSGHITIESSVTSQFENHLRAVAGLPLGATDLIVGAASMVNVIGSSSFPSDLASALPIDAAVHLYGKAHRPGRKLGHVTAVGDSIDEVIRRARRAAEALEPQGAGA